MELLIENDYKEIKYLGTIKRPFLNISFEIGNQIFTCPFRPDTGFITRRKSDKYHIKGCERLRREIEKRNIFGSKRKIQVADGRISDVTVFEGTITEISGTNGSIKPENMKVILSCMGCKCKEIIKKIPGRSIDCISCFRYGTPNVFSFDLMNLWVAEFNGPDQKFLIKEIKENIQK